MPDDTTSSTSPQPVSLEVMTRTTSEPTDTFTERKQPPAPDAAEEPRPQRRDPSTASRVAALSQRERMLQAREQELQAREDQLLATNPQYRQQIAQARQVRALEAHAKEVANYVSERPQDYEMLNVLGKQGEVAQLQFVYFQRSGQLITAEQAARLLEQHYNREWDRISAARRPRSVQPPARGVTRTVSSARRAPDWTDNRPLDSDERLRRAKAAMDLVLKRGGSR
jgi:hypothetical protein